MCVHARVCVFVCVSVFVCGLDAFVQRAHVKANTHIHTFTHSHIHRKRRAHKHKRLSDLFCFFNQFSCLLATSCTWNYVTTATARCAPCCRTRSYHHRTSRGKVGEKSKRPASVKTTTSTGCERRAKGWYVIFEINLFFLTHTPHTPYTYTHMHTHIHTQYMRKKPKWLSIWLRSILQTLGRF